MVICEYYDGEVNQLPTGGKIFKVYLFEQGGLVENAAVGSWGGGGGVHWTIRQTFQHFSKSYKLSTAGQNLV
jgi:hypothetical protein